MNEQALLANPEVVALFTKLVNERVEEIIEKVQQEKRKRKRRNEEEEEEELEFIPPRMVEVEEAMRTYKDHKGVNGMTQDFFAVGKTSKELKHDLWLIIHFPMNVHDS